MYKIGIREIHIEALGGKARELEVVLGMSAVTQELRRGDWC